MNFVTGKKERKDEEECKRLTLEWNGPALDKPGKNGVDQRSYRDVEGENVTEESMQA